mgnify:CR=1 FL=1
MATWNDLINDRMGGLTIATDASAIADTTGIDLFLADGVKDIIEQCRKHKPQLLPLFTVTQSQGGNTLAARPNIDVLKVTATTSGVVYFARYVSTEEITKALISGSIYAATAEDPIWSIMDGTITVLPSSVDASADTSASNPANFPTDLHYLLAIYGTVKVLQFIAASKVNDAVDNMATAVTKIGELSSATDNAADLEDVQDALDNAQDAINKGFTTDETSGESDNSTFQSVGYWLADEDTDMVSSTISLASQEISRANTIMAAMDKKTGIITSYTDTVAKFMEIIKGVLTVASSLQSEYLAFFKRDEEGAEGEA